MKKALILSDLHAHGWTQFATTRDDGVNSRFADLLSALDQAEAVAYREGADRIFILGDLTHRRYFVQFSIYTTLMERLLHLRRHVGPIRLLVGNHDIESTGVHSLGPLRLAGLEVIDEPTWTREGLFVPYMHEGIVEAVDSRLPLSVSSESRLFAHYALDGKVLTNEFALPSALQYEHVENFRKVILGHIHSPSVEHQGQVVYVGAPMHFDFGDSGERYCWTLDLESDVMVPHPLTAPRFVTTKYPRIPVKGFSEPGFIRILGVPAKEFPDVVEQALAVGWSEVVPVEAAVPTEAIRVLTSGQLLGEQTIKEYVAKHHPDLTAEEQQPVVDYGLSCLEEASR